MTYSELKEILYDVREKEIDIKNYLIDLANARSLYLAELGGGVTDYAKDRLQKTPDPDAATVNAIYKADRKSEFCLERLKELQDQVERYEKLIINMDGVGGVILRLFYLEGISMRLVSKRLNYDEKYALKLRRKAIKRLLEVINSEKT